jgi:hypothetical protein
MLDFVYDWLIHIVPRWLWWVLMVPLLMFVAYILAAHYWPEAF